MAKGKYLSNGQYYGFNVTSVNGQTGDVNVPTVAVSDTQPASNADIWIDTSEPSGESGTVVTKIGNAYGELTLGNGLIIENNKINLKTKSTSVSASPFSGNINFYRTGNLVVINYTGTISSLPAGAFTLPATIPIGYTPNTTYYSYSYQALLSGTFDTRLAFSFTSSNTIGGYNYTSAISSQKEVRFQVVYVTEDE